MVFKIKVIYQTRASITKAAVRKIMASSFSSDLVLVISIVASFTIMD